MADGAGGHNAGEVASALAVTSVANYFEATKRESSRPGEGTAFGLYRGERRLGAAVQKANRDIIEIANAVNQHRGMGTTIVALSFSPESGTIYVAHVGDSRCYRLRGDTLEQLTQDHSLLVDVLELRPDIDDDTLARLPTNVITRALGMEPNVRVAIRSHQPNVGDKYLLCSDGLTNSLTHEQIAELLGQAAPLTDIVEALIEQANREGGDDNIAAIVLDCQPGKGPPSEQRLPVAERTPRKRDAPSSATRRVGPRNRAHRHRGNRARVAHTCSSQGERDRGPARRRRAVRSPPASFFATGAACDRRRVCPLRSTHREHFLPVLRHARRG